ncbi:hypothetical protein DR950_01195 [Kitasatospora xanthocidica]|uniref:Uncharacterized protein n=1 Tax=Kitasatospora xanthocidica TaxID=83382 RepID=A0A372ZMA5_9ACTN|nr:MULTISPECIES: hypothetical protein [Kitasatospora]RGD56592.1 hypothetical protein DR950_01195 [Kitasatospora xanthocidica]
MEQQYTPAANAACVEVRTAPGIPVPVPATVLVVVVLLLTTALTTLGTPARTAVATLAGAGLLGIELVRRLAEALTVHRAR